VAICVGEQTILRVTSFQSVEFRACLPARLHGEALVSRASSLAVGGSSTHPRQVDFGCDGAERSAVPDGEDALEHGASLIVPAVVVVPVANAVTLGGEGLLVAVR